MYNDELDAFEEVISGGSMVVLQYMAWIRLVSPRLQDSCMNILA